LVPVGWAEAGRQYLEAVLAGTEQRIPVAVAQVERLMAHSLRVEMVAVVL
jgi:hypothetical protein